MYGNQEFSSNCYGFVYAGLHNSDEDFFKCEDDIEYGETLKEGELGEKTYGTAEIIAELLGGFSIIEIFDEEKRSQHVAFLDPNGKFYDQDGPDGPIRKKEALDNLLAEYSEKLGKISYKIHSIKDSQVENVKNFLKNL